MVDANDTPKIVAAIGNFDGVHRGHQHLLALTTAFAKSLNAAAGVVLFDPHPRRYFRPDDPPFLLTDTQQRDALLRDAGAREIYALPFDDDLAAMAPDAFIKDILKQKLGLAGVVAGADFRFGKSRAGDGNLLQDVGRDIGLSVKLVDLLSDTTDTDKFGSSAVRAALVDGAVDQVANMLGRPWSVLGIVEEGRKVGRTIGFPTANMTLGALLEPRKGVYATRATIDGRAYHSVSNFGRRPTVGSDAPLLETHVFDFDGDLYGKTIDVAFIAFLRDEQKFDGLEPLKAQIAADSDAARALLAQLDS